MRLVIMRHGEAEILAGHDQDRALTALGKREASTVGQWFAAHVGRFDLALVSPFKRAKQTFQTVQRAGTIVSQSRTLEQLVPSGNVAEVCDELWAIALQGEVSQLLVVSHMPLVAFLVETLDPQVAAPMFATCGLAVLELDGTQMRGHCQHLLSPHELGH